MADNPNGLDELGRLNDSTAAALGREVSIEDLMDLRGALGKLPSRDLEVLALVYVEQCNGQELATRLSLTPEAARQRLSRIKRRLRTLIGNAGMAEASADER